MKFITKIAAKLNRKLPFKGTADYWQWRYTHGGNSGQGSYGRTAEFKADIINKFIKANNVDSMVDFGCGDGNQLSLIRVKDYIGLDISSQSIKDCKKIYNNDKSKRFYIYNPGNFNPQMHRADLAISLDVIFHLVEDRVFESYMRHLFAAAKKYVIIFSTNIDEPYGGGHIKRRKFTDFVEKNIPDWKLVKKIERPASLKTIANFYIYKKK